MSSQRPLTDQDYERLSAYIDGALSHSDRALLELHLQNEPALRHELEALRQTVTLVNQLPPLKAPRDFTLEAEMIRPASPKRLLIFPASAAFSALSAAAAVLLLTLAGILSLSSGNLAAPPSPLQSQQVATNPTATAAIVLELEEAVGESNISAPSTLSAAPTQLPSPLAAPIDAAGAPAADDESQDAADGADMAMEQPAPTAPLLGPDEQAQAPSAASGFAASPTLENEFAGGPDGRTTSSPDPSANADAVASLNAAEDRTTVEETATSLSERFSLAQELPTPTPGVERDRSQAPSPTLAPEPAPPGIGFQDGLVQQENQESSPINLAGILLAAGLLLLGIAATTTIVRIRR
jgi:anti-sigma factor RsiW